MHFIPLGDTFMPGPSYRQDNNGWLSELFSNSAHGGTGYGGPFWTMKKPWLLKEIVTQESG